MEHPKLSVSLNEFNRYHELAWSAFQEKKYDALEFFLEQCRNIAAGTKRGLAYPLSVHLTHTYRGLVALDKNDRETAKLELLKSAMVRKSPMVSTFGPNMELALALLKLGERDVVLTFLKRCRKIWYLPFRLFFARKWERQIKEGIIPDFKGNLMYYRRPAKSN